MKGSLGGWECSPAHCLLTQFKDRDPTARPAAGRPCVGLLGLRTQAETVSFSSCNTHGNPADDVQTADSCGG